MIVFALDLASHAGYAVLEWDGDRLKKPGLLRYGTIELSKPPSAGEYPYSYIDAAEEMAWLVQAELLLHNFPLDLVIEETNKGRNRYTQKVLEFFHSAVLRIVRPFDLRVTYVNSDGSEGWRTKLGFTLTKEQRKANAKLSKAKREARDSGMKLDKKKLGIKGKVNKKHLAVNFANAEYGLKLKMKDNNAADAICIGTAFIRHQIVPCTGV